MCNYIVNAALSKNCNYCCQWMLTSVLHPENLQVTEFCSCGVSRSIEGEKTWWSSSDVFILQTLQEKTEPWAALPHLPCWLLPSWRATQCNRHCNCIARVAQPPASRDHGGVQVVQTSLIFSFNHFLPVLLTGLVTQFFKLMGLMGFKRWPVIRCLGWLP